METTYTKLKNPDEWGLRIKGQAKPGQKVTVKSKAGKTRTEIVDRVVCTGEAKDGSPVSLATIRKEEKEQAGEPVTTAGACLCQQSCCRNGCSCAENCYCHLPSLCEQPPF